MNLSISLHRLRQFPRCCWLHPFSVCFTVGCQAQTAAEFSGAVKTDSKTRNTQWGHVRTMLTKPYQTCYLLIFNGLCMSLQQVTASGVPTSWPFPVCTEADEIHRKDDPTPQDLSRSLKISHWGHWLKGNSIEMVLIPACYNTSRSQRFRQFQSWSRRRHSPSKCIVVRPSFKRQLSISRISESLQYMIKQLSWSSSETPEHREW